MHRLVAAIKMHHLVMVRNPQKLNRRKVTQMVNNCLLSLLSHHPNETTQMVLNYLLRSLNHLLNKVCYRLRFKVNHLTIVVILQNLYHSQTAKNCFHYLDQKAAHLAVVLPLVPVVQVSSSLRNKANSFKKRWKPSRVIKTRWITQDCAKYYRVKLLKLLINTNKLLPLYCVKFFLIQTKVYNVPHPRFILQSFWLN